MDRRELLRRGAVVGAGATVLGGLLGAGRAGAGVAAEAATVGKTISLWSQLPANTTYGQTFAAAGRRWKAGARGRSFRAVVVSPTGYATKFKTASAAGQAPDIWQASLDGSYGDLIKARLLTPLDDLIAEHPYFPVAVDRLKINGHIYAVPLDVNNLSVAYNKDVFAKLGLQPPRSIFQLIAVSKALRAGGYQPVALGVKDQWPAADVFYAMLAYTNPKGNALDDASRGKMSWTSPAFLAAAEMAQEIQSGGVLVDAASSVDAVGAYGLFGSQKAAMCYPGIGDMSSVVKDFNYGFFPWPSAVSSVAPRATGGPAVMFTVPSRGKNPAGAKQVLRLMADKAGIRTLVRNSKVPPFKADISSNTSPPFRAEVALQGTAGPRGILVPEVSAALFASMANLLGGNGSPRDVVDSMAKAAKS